MNKWHVPAALATVALVAGCGGSESEFRERAQAVCVRYAEQIEAIDRPNDLRGLADSSGQIADLIDEQVTELRELDAPGDLADDYERWLGLTAEAAGNARAIQTAAGVDDQQRVNELAGGAARNTLSSDRLARDLEIPKCMVEPEEN